ncbi:MAG: LysR family transcriptional regulator [Pseudomonadota bacterium]
MQIEPLETFLDLMETNSFNGTAARLGITQSTVSARIKVLEASLGKKLFTRSRAGTKPTVAGQRFADHARAMRHEWNEAQRALETSRNFSRSMRIGMQSDLADQHIGMWVSTFRNMLPETAFHIEPDYSTQMCADLLAGKIDFAVLFTPKHVPDIHYESIGEVRYRLVSDHGATLAEIDPASYIFADYSPLFDRAHRQILPGFTNTAIASGQNAAICNLLLVLGGSAFVLEETAAELIEGGNFRQVEDADPISQPVFIAVHIRNRHSHVHMKMAAIMRSHFAELK